MIETGYRNYPKMLPDTQVQTRKENVRNLFRETGENITTILINSYIKKN